MEALNEKVSVNINSSTLSGIDLLVDNGYYSNRSDFINQALRSALQQHQTTIDRIVAQHFDRQKQGKFWFMGVAGLQADDVRKLYEEGKQIDIKGYGVLTVDRACREEMLFSVVKSIQVKGKVLCEPNVKAHFGIK